MPTTDRQGVNRRSHETVVHDAVRAFDRRPATAPADYAPATRVPTSRGLIFSICAAVLAALSLILASVVSGAEAPACEPITYAFHGSPPPYAVSEFDLAVREIHRHSGLLFEEREANTARMHVTWAHQGVRRSTTSPALAGDGGERTIGYGFGRWRDVHGVRSLVAATIDVDATIPWTVGLGREASLAAVFVHELGHVIGLPHSPDPTSFMHAFAQPGQTGWTEGEQELLARAGRRAGCQPPEPPNPTLPR